jgi:hypothetical protein
MKKIFIVFVAMTALNSCKTEKESCVEGLVDKGYTHEEARDECEQLKEDSDARFEGN